MGLLLSQLQNQIRIGVDIQRDNPVLLARKDFGLNEDLLLATYAEDRKSEVYEDWLFAFDQIKDWHLMQPLVQDSFLL